MATNYANGSICPQCLNLLLWAWGHGIINKTQALRAAVAALRPHLGMLSTGIDNLDSKVDDIERIAEEIVQLPSPFQWSKWH
ncbi:MAG: hypothetical protein H8D43_03185 [Chloroflexi bacterium]|nr:hypothetical protein [Chloroflexota bacterium]